MSSLNILCAICSEFYKPDDLVYSTTLCGHLFHYQCLLRWLRQNASCPQCRRQCQRQRIHRVYLNFAVPTDEDEDYSLPVSTEPTWIPLLEDYEDDEELIGAIKAGTDENGNDAYVARAPSHGDLLPVNYVPKKKGALAPWGFHAHFLRQDIELLVDFDFDWVTDRNGHVPENALVTGYTGNGEKLYTGRSVYEGFKLPGKIHPKYGLLYMPFKELEVTAEEYEVLVSAAKKEDRNAMA